VIGAVAVGWLWTTAPRLAALFALEPTLDRMLVAVGSALASFVVALAIAWLVIAVLDALVRRVDLAHALAMTVTEKREDDRLAAADPRWRAQRLAVLRGPWSSRSVARGPPASSAVARSALVLLGDDTAVAIAWDARRQPVPVRTITGRGARATQLLGLARRHRIAVHRDAALAAALVDGDGPVPDTHWARLANILAAVQAANTGRDLSA
jgi:flagellar biosynthesis protein FlhB